MTRVASNVLANLSRRPDSRAQDAQGLVTGLDIFSYLFGNASAALAIVVVRDIDRRQAERARHVTYTPHTSPPPIFRPQPEPTPAAPGGETSAQPAHPPPVQH